jgi:uncharacterized protein YbjT (DUF2867 family)
MNRKAVVAGATGLIGKELVQLLISEPAYVAVTLLVRRPTGITHPKIYEKILDFDNLEQAGIDLTGADVFCTLGTTIKKAGTQEAFRQVDYTYPLTLGRMAKTRGAKQFLIVTSMGASSSSRFFYNRVKGDIEEALRNLDLPALQIFRPSLLLGNRKEIRIGERIASAVSGILSPLFLGPLRKYCPIQAHAVAKTMINAAQNNPAGIQVYESDQILQTQ